MSLKSLLVLGSMLFSFSFAGEKTRLRDLDAIAKAICPAPLSLTASVRHHQPSILPTYPHPTFPAFLSMEKEKARAESTQPW